VSIDRFADAVAILIFIVSNGYYGIPRGGQIHIKHPIMSFETVEIWVTTVSAKRSLDRLDRS